MVLLVIDTQKLVTNDELFQFERFVKNVKTLVHTAREKNIEVIYVRHDDGPEKSLTKSKPGYDVYEEFKPEPNEKIFDKTVNSPFKESGLLEYLQEKGENKVIITGLQTDYCIDATIKCGFEHGLEVFVPEYANTTVDNQYMTAEATYHYYNEFMWNHRYAKCLSMEDMLNQMK